MAKQTKTSSLTLDIDLWEAVETDAKHSRRSAMRQIEAILLHYYGIADTDIDQSAIERARALLQSAGYQVGKPFVGGILAVPT